MNFNPWNGFETVELEKVAEYCKSDVDITRRVHEFGERQRICALLLKTWQQN